MNKWQALKEYINSKPVGTIITRKDMRRYINNGPPPPRTSAYRTTDDNYRGILSRLGILETVERGKYKILYHIKSDLLSSEASNAASGRSWKSWFIDVKS
jgi:hypothetical protein